MHKHDSCSTTERQQPLLVSIDNSLEWYALISINNRISILSLQVRPLQYTLELRLSDLQSAHGLHLAAPVTPRQQRPLVRRARVAHPHVEQRELLQRLSQGGDGAVK